MKLEQTFEVAAPIDAVWRALNDLERVSHVTTMIAKGTDKRGQGGASATIVNTLTDLGDRTRVDARTDFSITGRLARFGRTGMIEDISTKLLQTFGDCLATRLGPSAEEAGAGAAPPPPVPPA